MLGGGVVWVIFGPLGSGTVDLGAIGSPGNTQGYRIEGGSLGDDVGHSVAALGDINGDAKADIAIGAPGRNLGTGAAYVVFGTAATGAGSAISLTAIGMPGDTHGFRIDGVFGDQAGMVVANAGDVDGNGVVDLLVGAPGQASGNGCLYVVFGKAATGAGSTVDLSAFGSAGAAGGYRILAATGMSLGQSAASIGDVNGDGRPDQLVGAPSGRAAFVVRGKATTGLFSDITVAATGTAGDWYRLSGGVVRAGWAVARIGDMNADGLAEVAVSDDSAPVGVLDGAGSVTVVYGHGFAGSGANVDLTRIGTGAEPRGFRIDGDTAFGSLGRSVASPGDVNGDGVADIAIGSSSQGAVWVVYGRATGGAGTTIAVSALTSVASKSGFKLTGPAGVMELGVAAAGDANGDGREDLLIGAIDATGSNGATAGQGYLVASFPVPGGAIAAPTPLAQTAATLAAAVNPEGSPSSAWFEWGTTTAYGSTTPAQDIGAGTSALPLAAAVTGLAPTRTYHARVVGSNAFGTYRSPDIAFTTPAPAVTVSSVATSVAWKVGRLKGSITLKGFATSASALRVTLSVAGRPRPAASLRLSVPAGAFRRTVTLPSLLLPGAFDLQLTGTSLGVAVQPTTRKLTIAAPAEGIVRRSWLTSYRKGTPKTVIRGSHTELWAYFVFAVKPTRPRARFTVVWIAPDGTRFGGIVGPYVPRFESFHREGRLAYGTWKALLYSGRRQLATARIRIKP